MAKRGRKPKEKTNYFGEQEEQAVLDYLNCEDDRKRNELYNTTLMPALNKMVESIIRRYNLFLPDELFEDTFNDTLSFLLTKMSKFENGKISKKSGKEVRAYSYYQTIVKNYLLARIKKYKKDLLRYPSYESAPEDISNSIKYTNSESRGKVIASDIVNKLIEKFKAMISEDNPKNLKESELQLGKALVNLLENWDFVLSTDGSNKLNKNAILFFLRENTGMDTKSIRDNLKKYKAVFAEVKKEMVELN